MTCVCRRVTNHNLFRKNLISQNFEIKMSHKCHTGDRREAKSNFHLLCVVIKLAKTTHQAKESNGRDFEE